MKIQLLRHATLIITVGELEILVDPMFAATETADPIANTPNPRRNPLVDLPIDEAALREQIGTLDGVIVTHLHNDHCENDYKCVNAQVFVQKKEMEFLNDPHPVDHRYYPDVLEGVKVTEIDGDAGIIEGIDVIYSPGHSPGGQSVSVNTAAGRVIITGFCCNDKNFPKTGPAIPPGVHIDLIEAYDSIQKIREMGDTILPLHDLSIGKRKSIP